MKALKGWISVETTAAFQRARDLCSQLDNPSQLPIVLFNTWAFHLVRLELGAARDTAQEILRLAESLQDTDVQVQSHVAMGNTLFWMGDLQSTYQHMERVMEIFDPGQQNAHLLRYGQDSRSFALMFLALTASLQGRIGLTRELDRRIRHLYEDLAHPFTTAISLQAVAWTALHLRDAAAVLQDSERLVAICAEQKFPFYQGIGTMFHGWALAMHGKTSEGINQIQEGFQRYLAQGGGKICHSLYSALIAEALGISGQPVEGLQVLTLALRVAKENQELVYESELLRLQGELTLAASPEKRQDAEKCFQEAIEVAERQQAWLLKIRCSTRLASLWFERGESQRAFRLLQSATHGFEQEDSVDLREAMTLQAQCGAG
jgi:predicted ATPase